MSFNIQKLCGRLPVEIGGRLPLFPKHDAVGMRISVITQVLNRIDFIEDAIRSVRSQAGVRIEHIIVDGGSTDGTLERLKQLSDIILISASNLGSYESMNRGLQEANGEIVCFLSSDDTLPDNALLRVSKIFEKESNLAAICGEADVFIKLKGYEKIVARIIHASDDRDFFDEILFGAPAINTWFFRRSILPASCFDIRWTLSADRNFLLKAWLDGLRPKRIHDVLYRYCQHPSSNTLDEAQRMGPKILAEHAKLSAEWMMYENLNVRHRGRIRYWHAWENTCHAVQLAKQGQSLDATKALLRAWARSPMLPLYALQARNIIRGHIRKFSKSAAAT
ncbi:MAG: glycosyltransferase [Alphaproteobacteria bacterium]